MFMCKQHQEYVREGRYDYRNEIDGENLLHKSCRHGDCTSVAILFENNFDLNLLNDSNQTALHVAVERKKSKVIKMLLDEGAEVNLQDIDRRTPLHKGAITGHPEIFELLIIYGAETNYKDAFNQTALHIACTRKKPKLVELLLDANIDINKRDLTGETALDIAFAKKNRSLHMLMISHILLKMKTDGRLSRRIKTKFDSIINPGISKLKELCRKDLEELNKTVEGTNISFLKLLTTPHNELSKLFIDSRIDMALEMKIRSTSFGFFTRLITSHYKRALRIHLLRVRLIKKLQEILPLPIELIR